jgi:hypothetical protein
VQAHFFEEIPFPESFPREKLLLLEREKANNGRLEKL